MLMYVLTVNILNWLIMNKIFNSTKIKDKSKIVQFTEHKFLLKSKINLQLEEFVNN